MFDDKDARPASVGIINEVAAFLSSFEAAVGINPDADWQKPLLRLRIRLTDEETTELCTALNACVQYPHNLDIPNSMRGAVAKEIADVIITSFSTARVLNINIGAVLQAVVEANLSKQQPDGSFIRDDGGKVMKGPHYVAPNLSEVML